MLLPPICLYGLLLLSTTALFSQPTFDDYGKISRQELLFSEEDESMDVDAIVVFDLGDVHLSQEVNRMTATYRYYRRIKILTEEGLEWAKVEIPYNNRINENVKVIKGQTFNLLANGDIESLKLEKKLVSDIDLNNEEGVVNFPLPGAQVGSVVEYVYQVTSDNIQSLRPWAFQARIPIKYSQFETYIPNRMKYVPVLQGDTRKLLRKVGEYSEQSSGRRLTDNYDAFGNRMYNTYGNEIVYGTVNAYVMKDMMPLEPEPYTTIPEDNIAKISFQLGNIRIPGRNNIYTWKMLNRDLLRDKLFGRYLEDDLIVSVANKVGSGQKRQQEKLERIFNYVQEAIEWSGEYAHFASNPLDEVLSKKRGNSADINLLLCAMLKANKFDAYPVLISTRDNGKAQMYYPDMTQFNHVIVGVKMKGDMVYLDGLSKGIPYNMLPRVDLNQDGFLIDKRNWGWVKIVPEHEIIRNTYTRFKLYENGMLQGELELVFKEYSAATERGKLQDMAEAKASYVENEFLKGLPKAKLEDFSIHNPEDIDSPVFIECKISTPDYVQQVEDLMFIRPLLTKSIIENPFQSEERIAPIDLPCPIREYYLLGLEIPEGFEIIQTPNPIRVLMPNDAGEFTYNVLIDESIVHVSSTIFIEKTNYLPQEYEEIKTFFEYIIRKHEEDIVLKRKTPKMDGK